MKIDIVYQLDGFINFPVGKGSYIRAELYSYRRCADEPDCRAGKGWPLGTISRRYEPSFADCYEVLFGTKTGEHEELFGHIFGPQERIGVLQHGQLKVDNVSNLPVGLFRSSAGMPISIHRAPECGGTPLAPDEWTTVESVDAMTREITLYAFSKGFIDIPEFGAFRDFLSKGIGFLTK